MLNAKCSIDGNMFIEPGHNFGAGGVPYNLGPWFGSREKTSFLRTHITHDPITSKYQSGVQASLSKSL